MIANFVGLHGCQAARAMPLRVLHVAERHHLTFVSEVLLLKFASRHFPHFAPLHGGLRFMSCVICRLYGTEGGMWVA